MLQSSLQAPEPEAVRLLLSRRHKHCTLLERVGPGSSPWLRFKLGPSCMMAKRGRNDEDISEDDELQQPKRRKYDQPSQIVDSMETIMEELAPLLPQEYPLDSAIFKIPRKLLNSGPSEAKVSKDLETFKDYLQFSAELDELKEGATEFTKRRLVACQLNLRNIISLANELQEALLAKPAPSEYAKASVWREVQTRPRPILCLRPTDKRGLPLTLLHPVFSRFRHLSRQPLPNSRAGVNALRAALRLCSCMGDAFDNEEHRSKAFDAAVDGFLQGVQGSRRVQGNEINGEADRVYRVEGSCMIFREDRVEIGDAGDAYTQLARLYDLACEQMKTNGVVPDAPVFLLSVMGPTLTIAGGFKDGDSTVVEPLCQMLFMLKDMDDSNGRAVQLATHLFALHTCMEQLPNLLNPPSPIPGVPRVFPSFQDAKGEGHSLTFLRRLDKNLFLFKAVDDKSRELCVKIVYSPYGEEVHQILSRENMAPDFLGVSRIEGGPTMIVMEMLDETWQTLYDFAQRNPRWTTDGVQSTIRKRLEMILMKLGGEGFVHGDFRANNIMVKPGNEESAVLIDFDWAGKDGKAHYPLGRNPSGISWPGEPGSGIGLDHDQRMLDRQWNLLLTGQF